VLAYGGFANAGQVCASVERVYAVGEAFAPLVVRVTEIAKSLRQQGPADEVDVGPMVTGAQLELVEAQVAEARRQGAIVHAGGVRTGAYFAPTVLTGVHEEMAICKDETFGPVLPIMQVGSIDEAVTRANKSVYGLSAYVFTRNMARGLKAAEALSAGTVVVNEVLVTHAAAETPWGGVKDSGLGHTHADSGLRHLCQMRHVNYSRLPMIHNPWGYPYRAQLQQPFLDLLGGYFGSAAWYARAWRIVRGAIGLMRHRPRD
jgi:succinate-semialdehyde dehydrogenase/glutarate-semialdehyde dehydrogenase